MVHVLLKLGLENLGGGMGGTHFGEKNFEGILKKEADFAIAYFERG